MPFNQQDFNIINTNYIFTKLIKVIDSCKNDDQINICYNYLKLSQKKLFQLSNYKYELDFEDYFYDKLKYYCNNQDNLNKLFVIRYE